MVEYDELEVLVAVMIETKENLQELNFVLKINDEI